MPATVAEARSLIEERCLSEQQLTRGAAMLLLLGEPQLAALLAAMACRQGEQDAQGD